MMMMMAPKVESARSHREIEVIKDMTDTVRHLNDTSAQLQSQAQILGAVPFQLDEAPLVELERLRALLRQHDAEHTRKMLEMKQILQDEIETGSVRILKEVRSGLQAAIEEEVKAEVDVQIQEHVPVPLRQQARETKEQLKIVNASLQNSKSRIANAGFEESNLYDPLSVVLTPEGKRSAYWPIDLGSLFAYDLKSVRLLVKDFGLVDSDQLQVNFQRFLAHIGTQVDTFIPSVKD